VCASCRDRLGRRNGVKLSAARTVFGTWLEVTQHFDFAEQVAQMQKRIKALENAR
jgi:hypothetical protein